MEALSSLKPPNSRNDLLNAFVLAENILRSPDQYFYETTHQIRIGQKIRSMLITSFVALAAYGALLGCTHSLAQTISSAIKLPLLFLVTLAICVPVLYIFSTFFGSNQSFVSSLVLVLAAITVTALLLLSLGPITLFLVMTSTYHYQLFKLLNVFLFGIAGMAGAATLYRGVRILSKSKLDNETQPHKTIFSLWVAVYIFVGSQMAWTLRPFVGYPDSPFELFRQVGGNFYTNIFVSIGEILGFLIVR